jgi:hypothetical protein
LQGLVGRKNDLARTARRHTVNFLHAVDRHVPPDLRSKVFASQD